VKLNSSAPHAGSTDTEIVGMPVIGSLMECVLVQPKLSSIETETGSKLLASEIDGLLINSLLNSPDPSVDQDHDTASPPVSSRGNRGFHTDRL
jgi:hypothetical protein